MSNLKQNCNLPWSLGGVWVLCRVSHIKWIFDLHHILIENICKEFSFLYICNLFFFTWLTENSLFMFLRAFSSTGANSKPAFIARYCLSCSWLYFNDVLHSDCSYTQTDSDTDTEGDRVGGGRVRERDVEIFKLQDKWKFISLAQTICLSCVFSL